MAKSGKNELLSARYAVVSTLIAKHQQEFDALMIVECEARGVQYKPEPSAEQVAREKIEALLAANPALRDEYSTFAPSGMDEFASAV